MNFNSIKTRLIIIFALFFILGIVFSISGSIENSSAENAKDDFNYMKEYEFKDGMYVKGRVYEIYGEFAVEETHQKTLGITTSKRVSSHYYVVPMVGTFEDETPKYIAVEISHVGMVEEAEKLMQQTWNYYDYNIDPGIWNEFDIKGKVTPLKGELLDYLYEWFMYGEEGVTRADFKDYICPYVITYRNTDGSGTVFSVIIAAIGAIGLTVMIMLHIKNNNAPVYNYNQFSYNSQTNTAPPYSPEAVKDMTDRGFPPPQPINQNIPVTTNSLDNNRFESSPEPVDSQVASMPSVGGNATIKSEANTSVEENSSEEKDWWSV